MTYSNSNVEQKQAIEIIQKFNKTTNDTDLTNYNNYINWFKKYFIYKFPFHFDKFPYTYNFDDSNGKRYQLFYADGMRMDGWDVNKYNKYVYDNGTSFRSDTPSYIKGMYVDPISTYILPKFLYDISGRQWYDDDPNTEFWQRVFTFGIIDTLPDKEGHKNVEYFQLVYNEGQDTDGKNEDYNFFMLRPFGSRHIKNGLPEMFGQTISVSDIKKEGKDNNSYWKLNSTLLNEANDSNYSLSYHEYDYGYDNDSGRLVELNKIQSLSKYSSMNYKNEGNDKTQSKEMFEYNHYINSYPGRAEAKNIYVDRDIHYKGPFVKEENPFQMWGRNGSSAMKNLSYVTLKYILDTLNAGAHTERIKYSTTTVVEGGVFTLQADISDKITKSNYQNYKITIKYTDKNGNQKDMNLDYSGDISNPEIVEWVHRREKGLDFRVIRKLEKGRQQFYGEILSNDKMTNIRLVITKYKS